MTIAESLSYAAARARAENRLGGAEILEQAAEWAARYWRADGSLPLSPRPMLSAPLGGYIDRSQPSEA